MNFLNNKVLIGGAILVFLFIGVFFAIKSVSQVSQPAKITQDIPQEMITSATPTASTSASMENLVTITATGFSPKEVTIKSGESVTFVNSDSSLHAVNSDPHPQHTASPLLNEVSRIAAGEKKSLTFPKMGTFKFHDHLNPQFTGTVIVQ